MNDQHLDLVLRNYIDKFDEMNDPRHNETYKWEAVRHFQEHWNIEADDFAAMFRKAIGTTDNLINNRVVQPTAGILELARHDPEAVRRLFQRLYLADDGDLRQRQDRIIDFVAEANTLLERLAPGKWKLVQDTRTAIAYLSLRHPDDNYIYKATPARTFGRCVEFGHEIGSGNDFRLSQYYHLCDWLVEAVQKAPDLLAAHRRRLCDRTYADERLHVLAYDIIYCAQAYGLYENIDMRKSRRSGDGASAGTAKSGTSRASRRNRAKEELQARQMERRNRLNAIQEAIAEVHSQLEQVDTIPLVGLEVRHRKYGSGKVILHENSVITVRFDAGDRKFALPCAFTDCFLTTDDIGVMRSFSAFAEVIKDERRLERERQLIQCEAL